MLLLDPVSELVCILPDLIPMPSLKSTAPQAVTVSSVVTGLSLAPSISYHISFFSFFQAF